MTDLAEIRSLVAGDSGLAMVSVCRADGSVHTSLVNAGVSAHPVSGEPVVSFVVRGDASKLRLMRRDGRCTVAWRNGWRWGSVDGPVEICGPDHELAGVETAAVPELLRQVFRDAGGSHDDWDEYDRVMADERRTAIFVQPARILGRT
jgi:PPOX class probable F420-dependent enzyme